jgi:hypothetical protein
MVGFLMSWSWRGHGHENIVSDVYEIVEKFTSEIFDSWIFEIVFDL